MARRRMWLRQAKREQWLMGALIVLFLSTTQTPAQFPGSDPSRIPPTRVPGETTEPPLASPNEIPPTARPARPAAPTAPRTPATASPESTDPPTPVVCLRVRSPAVIAVGATEAKITITAENTSAANAFHVRVNYTNPSNAKISQTEPPAGADSTEAILRWHFDELKPGEKKSITITYVPKDDNDVKHVARVSFEHGEQVVVKQNRPDIKIERISPSHWHEGEAVTVKLIVENKGRAEARNVVVSDTLEDGLEHDMSADNKAKRFWTFESIKPGEKREETYTVHAKRVGKFAGKLTVSAAGVAEQIKPWTVVVGKPLLELNVKGPERASISEAATYEITARNTGTIPLDNVAVVYQLKGVKVIKATQGAVAFKDRLQWTIDRFEPGSERQFSVRVQANSAGSVVNVFELLGRNVSQDKKVVTQFAGAAALDLKIKADKSILAEREKVTYTVTVRNTGTKPAEKVKLKFSFPLTQMKYVSGDERIKMTADQGEIGPVDLPVKETLVLKLTFEATANGIAMFRVLMSSDDLTAGDVIATESTTITPGK